MGEFVETHLSLPVQDDKKSSSSTEGKEVAIREDGKEEEVKPGSKQEDGEGKDGKNENKDESKVGNCNGV